MSWGKKSHPETTQKGQALAEFALIIVAVLLLIFLILDVSRVLWGWVTVQSAARAGARYAITGQDDCGAADRLQCVITTTYGILDALPLNEDPGALFEDDNFYLIEVYGADAGGQLLQNFAGAPGQPVIVRVIYRVPIITPLLQPIRSSLPVFGQVVMNNEQWTNLGGATAGVGLPPAVPPLPTPGVTPSPTPTDTPGPTATPTSTPSNTPTPTPTRCDTQFEGSLVHGNSYANVTGDGAGTPGADITIFDTSVTTTPGVPRVIGTAEFDYFDGHACPGFVQAPVSPPLIGDHVILVRNDNPGDGSFDTAVVLTATPTPTPTPSPSAEPTATPSPTPLPSPSSTPIGPWVSVEPSCGFGPTANIDISGFNWDPDHNIDLFWVEEGESPAYMSPVSGPVFVQHWQVGVGNGSHRVEAYQTTSSGTTVRQATFTVPCPGVTATPPAATATPTLSPADLVIEGPTLISTPPIVGYRPVQFGFTVTNSGSTDVDSQFFTDLYLDLPTGVYTDSIDLIYSDGYQALSGLAAGASRVLTITSPLGFTGDYVGTRTVTGMVDSLEQVEEAVETNNITGELNVEVTPGVSPTPSPTPGGSDTIGGQVWAYVAGRWVPQRRAQVTLLDSGSGSVVSGPILTAPDGRYAFPGIPSGTYNAYACIVIENVTYYGTRPDVSPPSMIADIFMVQSAQSCP